VLVLDLYVTTGMVLKHLNFPNFFPYFEEVSSPLCVKTNGKAVGPSITQLCLCIRWYVLD